MAVMMALRITADLALFYTFGGFVAAKCGGTGAVWGMIIQCLCFELAYALRERGRLRFAALVPMVLGWVIYARSLPDCILLIPAALYVIWLVAKEDFSLDYERHKSVFGGFLLALVIFLVVAWFMRSLDVFSAVAMPYAVAMLVCTVLLMRSLRHEKQVYCQRRYQLVNLAAVAAVGGAAWVVSSKTVRGGVGVLLKAFHQHILSPIFELLLNALLYILQGAAWLFSLLSLKDKPQQEQEIPEISADGAEKLFGDDYILKEPSELVKMLGKVLLIAAVVAALVLLFRWMSRRRGVDTADVAETEVRDEIPTEAVGKPRKESSPVRTVRAQYRKFLKLCASRGVEREAGFTSLDVHERAQWVQVDESVSGEIRDVYIKARYDGKADKADAQRIKKLCTEARSGKRE